MSVSVYNRQHTERHYLILITSLVFFFIQDLIFGNHMYVCWLVGRSVVNSKRKAGKLHINLLKSEHSFHLVHSMNIMQEFAGSSTQGLTFRRRLSKIYTSGMINESDYRFSTTLQGQTGSEGWLTSNNVLI